MGNGVFFDVEFYYRNGNAVPVPLMKNVKYFYHTTGGGTDTLQMNLPDSFNEISAPFVTVTFDSDIGPAFLSIHNLIENSLNRTIRGSNLYLKFPDGHIDTINVTARNKEDCDIKRKNYYLDGVKYNNQDAEYIYNPGITHQSGLAGRFKVYID